jgi:hypothetical protein
MQKKLLLFIVAIPIFLSQISCVQSCEQELPETNYQPVVLERGVFESSIQIIPQQAMTKSGKIYIKENLMVVNDVNKGFHIYNYSNPENPIKIAFLKVPGATDVAIRNNFLYINQAVDLITLSYDLTNNSVTFLNRVRNVFPQKTTPDGFTIDVAENQIIVDWTTL